MQEKFIQILLREMGEGESLIRYMISSGLIPEQHMKYYLIYKEFPALSQEKGSKNATYVLAQRYGFRPRFIYDILKRVKAGFEKVQ